MAFVRAGPRVVVGVRKEAGAYTVTGRPHESTWFRKFRVVVANSGRGPITIRDVGLHAEGATGSYISVTQLRERGVEVAGPELPHRVEGEDFGEWLLDGEDAAAALGATTPVRGYAEQVRVTRRGSYIRKSSRMCEFNASPEGS